MLKSILLMLISFIVFTFISCSNNQKLTRSGHKTYKPIVKTKQIANLTITQRRIIKAAIVEDIKFHSESCENKKIKRKQLNRLIFIQVKDKNPSQALLNQLSKNFNNQKKILAAKDGLSVFRNGLLIGYANQNKTKRGYLITISIAKRQSSKLASVDLSHSETSLGGVYKTYQLKKKGSKWTVTGCKVNAYN